MKSALTLTLLLLACRPGAHAAAGAGPLAGACKGCNLLMISITNVGTDHMSLYGYGRRTTPNLDEWAKGALVFEDAYTPASWTLPAATSLFTGLFPYAHRVMGRAREDLLSEKISTLPELLRGAGYRTAAFTGGLDYMTQLGHMRGFATAPENPGFTRSAVTVKQAREWLAANKDSRFFLLVHSYDPHPPFQPEKRFLGVFSGTSSLRSSVDTTKTYRGYREGSGEDITAYYHAPNPPPSLSSGKREKFPAVKAVLKPADVAYLKDLYDEAVLGEDAEVGALLASLDERLLAGTVVVVLSEHGEMFARHGRFGRAGAIRGAFYDEVVHVPLLMRLPGEGGRRVRGLVQLEDVMPTLLELLGLPVPERQGRSLLPLISSGTAVNDYVFGGGAYNGYMPETYGPYPVSSVNEYIRDLDWKLIHEVRFPAGKDGAPPAEPEDSFELYNVSADPAESVDLAASRPEKVAELAARLREWARQSRLLGRREDPGVRPLPPEVKEKAKQHGYW